MDTYLPCKIGDRFMTVSRRSVLKYIGTVGTLSITGCLDTDQADLPGSLSVEWTSDTATDYDGNHHAIATATVDGQSVIGIPRNGPHDTGDCGVVAVDSTGEVLWSNHLPPEHCNAHAIGDVGVSDLDGDDRPEFLAATETQGVFAYDAAAGEETFRQDLLNSIGYSAPVVADLTGDGMRELAVVDFAGNLSVVRADGSVVWTHELEQPVYVTPLVADFTGNGTLNLAVNHGRRPSEVVCFEGDGEVVWRTEQEHTSLAWSLIKQEAEPALAITVGENLVLLDGRSGDQQWSTEVGDRVAVGEADQTSVFATAGDGVVRALDLADGDVRWMKQVTDEDVRMTAPALGSIARDETTNVAAVAYDGTVAVLDAESGDLLARRRVDAELYTSPVPIDVSGDGRDEVIILYGDGRVAALSYDE